MIQKLIDRKCSNSPPPDIFAFGLVRVHLTSFQGFSLEMWDALPNLKRKAMEIAISFCDISCVIVLG